MRYARNHGKSLNGRSMVDAQRAIHQNSYYELCMDRCTRWGIRQMHATTAQRDMGDGYMDDERVVVTLGLDRYQDRRFGG